jgi:DNA-binding beta-propeller fold protein YncE
MKRLPVYVLLICVCWMAASCPVDPEHATLQSGSTADKIPLGAAGLGFITSFGGTGTAKGQFKRIGGLAAANGRVYVTDQQVARIQVFDYNGKFLTSWGSGLDLATYGVSDEVLAANLDASEDTLFKPMVLEELKTRNFFRGFDAAMYRGDVLVLNNLHSRAKTDQALMSPEVLEFSPDGELVRIHDIDSLLPVSIACDEEKGNVVVGDVLNSCYEVFRLDDGGFLSGNKRAFNRDYRDYLEKVYQEQTPELRQQKSDEWMGKGAKNGEFSYIAGVAFYNGMVIAVDMNNRRLQVFREDGSFMTSVVGSGPARETLFTIPFDIAVTKNGVLYLSDQSETKPGVTAFSSSFKPLYKLAHPQLTVPGYIEITEDGYLFVTDMSSNQVFVFGPKSKMVEAGQQAASQSEGAE